MSKRRQAAGPRDVSKLGYEVEPVLFEEEEAPTVYRVQGYGVLTYVAEDDKATWASLADPDAHKARKKQAG